MGGPFRMLCLRPGLTPCRCRRRKARWLLAFGGRSAHAPDWRGGALEHRASRQARLRALLPMSVR
jgi:hypothetical protein